MGAMSPTPAQRRTGTGRYHHGNLRAALVDAAVELIAERGVRDFSLAELSRRLGVSVAAPYRHFADREALLAAVAVRALGTFGEIVIRDAAAAVPPADRLAAMARDYVRFAGERRPLFDTMFAAGIDKTGHPEVHRAEEPIDAAIQACVRELCPGDPAAARALEGALTATAHGFATLLLDGAYGSGQGAVDEAAQRAGRAALAIIAGRTALTGENRPPGPPRPTGENRPPGPPRPTGENRPPGPPRPSQPS
jgi:AcrR family transcriptional regulator